MLSNYINAYIDAIVKGDKREMERIERELRTLGMDRATIMAVAKITMKEKKGE